MELVDIGWENLALGFGILVLPAFILWKYQTGLLKSMSIAVLRMTLQLIFVGYYLEYLFEYDSSWLNISWILFMIVVADFSTIDRSDLIRDKRLIFCLFGATLIAIIVIDLFFLKFVLQLPNIFAAQYAIPITGMVLGNCLRSNIIGINSFYHGVHHSNERFRFYLASGASRSEAVLPFFRDALRASINPTLGSMATIGIVSLPGMMTGQILSGSSPLLAIRYQILIMIAIFSASVLSVYLGIKCSNWFIFDENHNFDYSIIKET